MLENESNDIQFEVDEDEGLDLNKPKVQIIEDEEETPEQKEKKQRTIKNIKKYGSIGFGGIVFLGLILFLIFRPKEEERILPYSIESGSDSYTVDGTLKEDSFLIEKYESTSEYYGIAFKECNMKDNPSTTGANNIITVEKGSSVHILGDVVDKEGNFLNWYYCFYGGKFGYLSIDNIENYNRRDGLVLLEELESNIIKEEPQEPETVLTDEEQSIKEKAFIKEIENVNNRLSKYSKYDLESYCILQKYLELVNVENVEWIESTPTETGEPTLELTTDPNINNIIILKDSFDKTYNEFLSATDITEEETLDKELQDIIKNYINTYGPMLSKEEYDIIVAEQLAEILNSEFNSTEMLQDNTQNIEVQE